MHKFTWTICALAVFLAVCPISTSSALGATKQEWMTNNSGRDATNLEKFLVGDVRISSFYAGTVFPTRDYIYDATEDVTTLKWSGATVADGQSTWACFTHDQDDVTYKYLPRWTYDEAGTDFVIAGPALSSECFAEADRAYLILRNTALDSESITIAEIDVGYADRVYEMDELVSWDVNGVEWTDSRAGASVPIGGREEFDIRLLDEGVLIYRARLYLESQPDNVVECVGQHEMPVAYPPAGATKQEWMTNNSGRDATNLEKFLVGDVRISSFYAGTVFPTRDYIYDATEDVTTLKWSGATVADGQSTWACFTHDQDDVTYKYLPRWTYDEAGTDFVIAGPALSSEFFAEGDRAFLILGNTALDSESITIAEIDLGYADRVYEMGELVSWDVSGVEWTDSRAGVSVPVGGAEQFDIPLLDEGVLIYRARLYLESQPDNVVECIGQYRMPVGNPTVSQWGLIVMAALLVTAGAIAIRRRRQVAM